MNGREKQIGFSQRVRLEWLSHTASLVLAGKDETAVRVTLREMLKDQLSSGSNPERGTREKAITILMNVWVCSDSRLERLREAGLALLRELPKASHLPVHWGMCLAAYPFWGVVATHTGRLLRLQGMASAPTVQRRVREQYGERETVARAARRVLRSFIDWEVLTETQERGVYEASPLHQVREDELSVWLVEAYLVGSKSGSTTLRSIPDAPALFPLSLPLSLLSSEHLQRTGRLEVIRQGFEEDLVMLRSDGRRQIR